MAPRFNEALQLVENEFNGLDGDRQYRNAFARLLKPDPLERVPMLGTDQRDLFVPVLRALIPEAVAPGGRLFDVGGGDGQTFALLADRVPDGVTVSVLEPNRGYAQDYLAYLATQRHLAAAPPMVTGFEQIDGAGAAPPEDGSVDLVLALHMLYFLADPGAGIVRMARLLKPGGALCVVAADETDGYTGHALRAFLESRSAQGSDDGYPAAIARRESLLGGAVLEPLADALPQAAFELDVQLQPSRLYGHTLADLIALSAIAELAAVEGTGKFTAVADLLRDRPETVDLRIEDGGPRKGMWSVSQPQHLAILHRDRL